jgi:hypothetical protein
MFFETKTFNYGAGTKFQLTKILITKFQTHKAPNNKISNHKFPKIHKKIIPFMFNNVITVLVGWNGKWRFSPGMLGICNAIFLCKHFLCSDDCECRLCKGTF